MSRSRILLIAGGLALAVWGMSYGLWYAVMAEHQTLDGMGTALAIAFARGASRDSSAAVSALRAYAAAQFRYTRQVDAHSHWIGLAMLLIFLGLVFDNLRLGERARLWTASALLVGAFLFPGGVLLQTAITGATASLLAVVGAAAVTIALIVVIVGLVRAPTSSAPPLHR